MQLTHAASVQAHVHTGNGPGNGQLTLQWQPVKAFTSTRDGSRLSTIELKKFCSENLPLYMVPDFFSSLESLPKTSTDKIDYQKLSEERAAAVARYFQEVQNIPMRRILMPVGYSTTHRLASNSEAEGRELNRRVDVKVLVNKGIAGQ